MLPERGQRLEVGYILDIKMTVFSTAEEQQREPLEIGGRFSFTRTLPCVQRADASAVAPWGSYILQDREVISGQNPFSDEAFLKLLLPALNRKKKCVGKGDSTTDETCKPLK
jgi:putative intracellular protease/amidase